MKPVLTLKKREHPFIVGNSLHESYDREVVLKLLSSNLLLLSWAEADNWAIDQAKALYKNEKELIQKYLKKYHCPLAHHHFPDP